MQRSDAGGRIRRPSGRATCGGSRTARPQKLDSPLRWRVYVDDMVHIELLYFGDCPSLQHAWKGIGAAIAEAGVDANVRLRNIDGLPDEQLEGFGGSPTVRIDGRDLESYDGPPVLACRLYPCNQGRGWPSQEQLQEALRSVESAGVGA